MYDPGVEIRQSAEDVILLQTCGDGLGHAEILLLSTEVNHLISRVAEIKISDSQHG